MKNLLVLLVTFILGVSDCLGQTDTKAFRYDTIPAPAKDQVQLFRYDTVADPRESQSQQPLYKIEQPVQQQQQTSQSKPAQQPLSYSGGQSQGRMVFGGSFGMAFGSGYASVNISPQVGYEFNRYFTAGGGVGYFYYRDNSHGSDFSQNYLGLNTFARIHPIRFISLQVQPEIYQMWGSVGGQSLDSQTVPCVLVGGGVNIPSGRNGAVTMMIHYDVVQNDWSPYGNQMFYSVGYIFGF
ncbi:hypothetical protein [Dysgonomonas alginatilytica]|nr:hypothetical protein [Dysgonomonas alginatilytica]